MKAMKFLCLLLLITAFALVGCEGDEGPAGPTGATGPEGPEGPEGPAGESLSCTDCHGTAEFMEIQAQYGMSGHIVGGAVAYAGGRASCAMCHSNEGFVQWAELGGVDGDIAVPTPVGCATCHTIHDTFEPDDYALRTTDPVVTEADETYSIDFGDSSNLCGVCHQSRRPEPNIDAPGDTYEITSTHYGPHHGAQANVVDGTGFAEIAGDATYAHEQNAHTCVACHMSDYSSDEAAGGHTWIVDEAHCAGCHGASFIGDTMDAVQVKLDALRDDLLALGVIEEDAEEPGTYHPVTGTYPMVQVQAFFNWVGLVEDRSAGIHNPDYVNALLDNTIAALAD